MLKKIRIFLAVIFFISITLLLLDYTGTLHTWLWWMTKIQFLPAVLAVNLGFVALLVLTTLLLGRVYCSIICPLGIFQDIAARIGNRHKKLPYSFSLAKSMLRYSVLGVFVFALLLRLGFISNLIEPYSAYGRMIHNLLLPIVQLVNNGLAYFAERMDSYAFYTTDVWLKSLPTLIVAATTFIIVWRLAALNGRTYCNTICPVGTILGFLSRYSCFQVRIDEKKCKQCGLCEYNCKAACIDSEGALIDHSRCVSCMNCISKCKQGALRYKFQIPDFKIKSQDTETANTETESSETIDEGRKGFLIATMILAGSALKAQVVPKALDVKVDGGLADIIGKTMPQRLTQITPPGSSGTRNMKLRCTACQLCVTICPNSVLRPSNSLGTFMQPYISYERGWCRPECVKCSEVCPTGAIKPISKEEKSSTQIGHAVFVRERCIPLTVKDECGNCARHCPTNAITMVHSVIWDDRSPKRPAINEERCIGCGACEYLCPARPLSAIYVEGHKKHKEI